MGERPTSDTLPQLISLDSLVRGWVGVDARMWMDVLVSLAVCWLLCFLCIFLRLWLGHGMHIPSGLVRPGLAWLGVRMLCI